MTVVPVEEEGTARDEGDLEEEEQLEEAPPPRKGRKKVVVLGVIVVVLALVGAVTAFVLLRNGIPTADFTYTAVDKHLVAAAQNSTDSDGDVLTFTWNWGDGSSMGSGVTASHDYAGVGVYTVVLTVQDGRGGAAAATKSITIVILPTPFFIARQYGMTTTFDASASRGSPGHSITSYAWTFGDAATASGPSTSHAYSVPGRYTVGLTVTDDGGLTNTVSHYVSANTTTVDVLGKRFFVSDCPYQNYWYLRHNTYGDVILNRNTPCTDYYPWILYSTSRASQNPSYVYSLWRLDIIATNNFGYSVSNPVYLPVFNTSVAPAANSYINMNLTFNYLNRDNNLTDPLNINYWDTTAWPVNFKYSDGFGYLVRGNITMDLTESKRIFGVVGNTPAAAQSWWYRNTSPGGKASGVETQMGQWLVNQGNGKYDIWNGFQWYYEADITDLNATVASDGTTTIRVFMDGWGFDVLFARWSYWGAVNYSKAITSPYGAYPPKGWMPFETCWCENGTINATIRNSLDMHYSATSEYWFSAVGNPGQDGSLGTSDDLPGWSFSPSLMDYVPPSGSGLVGASAFPHSELFWYESHTATITSPGSYGYGTQYEYIVVPNRWNMSLGNTLTIVMPTGQIPWYDPVKSKWDSVNRIGQYVTYNSALRFRLVSPVGGYWLWDPRGKVLSMAAPAGFQWPDTGVPLNPEPYIEFGPESTGP